MAHQTALLFICSMLLIACSKSGSTGANSAKNPTATTGTSDAIPIGIAFAQTSNVALLGQEGTDGVKIAEKYFNAQGGINGKPIKLIYQ
ncbi:MAG: ABC transporter substrate-binding protein, partial [Nostoc sp.]